jgi:hypothetical protein
LLGPSNPPSLPATQSSSGLTTSYPRSTIIQGPDGRLYRSVGRPILWSGDVAAMKRLKKVNKLMHHLFPSHHMRRRVRR